MAASQQVTQQRARSATSTGWNYRMDGLQRSRPFGGALLDYYTRLEPGFPQSTPPSRAVMELLEPTYAARLTQ